MNIDWKLLAYQKRRLVAMERRSVNAMVRSGKHSDAHAKDVEALSGIIYLIDALQDEHRERKPKNPRITIEVRGGVVVDTRSNVPDLDVIIQDHDNNP